MAAFEMNAGTAHGTVLSQGDVDALRSRVRGPVFQPGESGYDEGRRVWNGMIERSPGVIARCSGAADVMACVNFARDSGARLAVRGGGHNVAGLAVADGAVVIDLSAMNSVRVDPARRTASAGGGAKLGDLDHETQAFGLAAPVGVVSATGIGGLTLHGGYGWLARRFGLSVDNLLSVEIVTADGNLRRASANEHLDLFWAVRGGGGNFGVVTAFEFRLHPVGPQVWLLLTLYAADRTEAALGFFREQMASAPDELGAIAVLWSAPHLPEVPRSSWGAPVLVLAGCYTGDLDEGRRVVEPFRTFATPVADLSGILPFAVVQKLLDADYPNGRRYYWKSLYLDQLDEDAIRALDRHAAARPSPLSSLDVWALGGALGRIDPHATAFGRRDAPFMLGIEANWDEPEHSGANIAWARAVHQDMQRFSRGGSYLNFPGFVEEGETLISGAYGPNYERLRSVKAKYDPENLFAGNLNIPPK